MHKYQNYKYICGKGNASVTKVKITVLQLNLFRYDTSIIMFFLEYVLSSLFHMLYMPSLELFWILENLISVKTDNFNSWYYTYIAQVPS